MIETRHLKSVVIFIQIIINYFWVHKIHMEKYYCVLKICLSVKKSLWHKPKKYKVIKKIAAYRRAYSKHRAFLHRGFKKI